MLLLGENPDASVVFTPQRLFSHQRLDSARLERLLVNQPPEECDDFERVVARSRLQHINERMENFSVDSGHLSGVGSRHVDIGKGYGMCKNRIG